MIWACQCGGRPGRKSGMGTFATLILFLALAGCSGIPVQPSGTSPCATSPGGYQCQIERYQKAS